MKTVTKIFSDIPFAHRQYKHEGQCQFVHGHNWSFFVTFGCHALDKSGFVVDLGDLQVIKDFIWSRLDHAMLISNDDPELHTSFVPAARKKLIKLYILPEPSCEGIAEHLYQVFSEIIRADFSSRVFIMEITVMESSTNSAKFLPSVTKTK